MSLFEQVSIIRPGSTAVFGSSIKGIQWGLLAADYLLLKATQSERYSGVICITFDRKIDDIVAPLVSSFMLDVSKIKHVAWNRNMKKAELLSSISSMIKSINGNVAVFIFSITEMYYELGSNETIEFIKSLCKFGENGSRFLESIRSVVGVIHETLHPIGTIRFFQSLFNTVAWIRPNDGTMSSTVLCDIQCIRKSPVTGKYYEATELFDHKCGTLAPITTRASGSNVMDNNIEHQAPHSELVSELMGIEKVPAVKQDMNTDESPAPITRLIAFDSNDPEFDEDSDPDNDLDL